MEKKKTAEKKQEQKIDAKHQETKEVQTQTTEKSGKQEIHWSPEDNKYLNNVLGRFNLVLAFIVILSPIIASFFCLIGVELDVLNVYIVVIFLYVASKIIDLSLNWRFIRFKKKDIFIYLFCGIFAAVLLASIVVDKVTFDLFLRFSLFVVVLIFWKVDKKHYRKLLYTFVITISVCSVMGLCDMHNAYMPGFNANSYPMSLQFFNPNYSAYITVMAIIFCMYIICHYKTIAEQIIFWICYIVLNVAFFINGCFSAETALFVGELFLIIYLWIKNKKCPWIILLFTGISIVTSFIRIDDVSTSGACYLYESLAVIDNKLGTHLLKDISTFFHNIFGTQISDHVAGSDGWDRTNLMAGAIRAIFASPRSFIFGNGSGFNYQIRVHNVYVQMWLEYGVITLAVYLTMLVWIAVRMFKTGFSKYNIFHVVMLFVTMCISQWFGCLEEYSFSYYLMFLTVFAKIVYEKHLEKQAEIKPENENVQSVTKKDK